MENIYDINGLVFWNEEEIHQREYFRDFFAKRIESALKKTNAAWQIIMVEAPLLTPASILNENYTGEDIWVQDSKDNLALRPETTPGSYLYASHILNNHSGIKTPFVVWQAGKSFRREIVQPTKHMRLKEFYQQEFQCLYTSDSANDYHSAILEPVRKMIAEVVHLPTRIISSDRLPSYSVKTIDVEVHNGDKWMEVCSISLRTDYPEKVKFQTKSGVIEKDILVLEIAIGLDRILYNWKESSKKEMENE